ncbi:MAG: phosphatase PAP2 family protein, partial [Candidatus Poseidoniaceae archaeon]|nr:phosphatase PAP2 family protein [Candidatus Poseidoniaceae archaeon]
EPMKTATGHWTEWIYAIEGNATLWIQEVFQNPVLTEILNFHYLFIYLFLIYITTIYFAFVGERDMTDKVTLNYLLIYAIAVPYYLFFNVEVTSSWIPGMDALLYHDAWYTEFYATHDPLDNAVPSLHIAIPFGIILLNWLHVRERGMKMKEWAHYRYHLFIVANTLLFSFTILYLGIHWIVDIPLGMAVGAIGALFIHHVQPRMRNDHGPMFEGVNRRKVMRHVLVEGVIGMVLLVAIFGAVAYQESEAEDRVSFRLGEGDVTYDIIQRLDYGESVSIEITNLGEDANLHVTYMQLQASLPAMGEGEIDWEKLVEDSGSEVLVNPGSSTVITIDESYIWHLLFIHNPSDSGEEVMEVRVMNKYDEDSMLPAFLLSLPSLWITGFVIHRLVRLKLSEQPLISSLPSYKWNGSEE